MRATISTGVFLVMSCLLSCGGRTLLDDPSDELPLRDAGNAGHPGAGRDAGTSPPASSGNDSGMGQAVVDAGNAGTVACGTTRCDSATEDCCAMMTAMAASASCTPKGKCTGVVAMCTSAADCSEGQVCCGSLGGGGGGGGSGGFSLSSITVHCEKSCGAGGFQLCQGDSECSGTTCQDTGFGPKLCGGLGAFGGGAFGGATAN